jgi:hypothetical protein
MKPVRTMLVSAFALLACASPHPDAGAGGEPCGASPPRVAQTVVVEIGRSTREFVRRRFGTHYRRDANSEDQERWLYDARRLPVRAAGQSDDRQRRAFELLSCAPPPPPGWSVTQQLVFRFDGDGRVADVGMRTASIPLVDESEP